jgi:hypothetical protein
MYAHLQYDVVVLGGERCGEVPQEHVRVELAEDHLDASLILCDVAHEVESLLPYASVRIFEQP